MRKFIAKHSAPPPKAEIEKMSQRTGLGKIVSRLILERGFDPDVFLKEQEYHDPFLLHDMQKAVDCIQTHIAAGNVITLFGDYDVDGVSASAILFLYLQSRGAKVRVIIPTRQDGYGLSIPLLQRAIDQGSRLIITVDCGVSSVEEAKFCQEKGIDLVITDHHQVPKVLPGCVAVVDPLLGSYPTPHICGAGVAGKLVQALGGTEKMEEYLDLMTIATIADVVPLTGENRTIVQKGLRMLAGNCRESLLALKTVAGIQNNLEVGNIAFGIAPRLNASGRIATAMDAFHLLTETDYDKALELAKNIDITNKLRQKQEEKIVESAFEMIGTQVDLKVDRIILLQSPDWNKGIIGIVASKIVERYHRPVILFANEDGILSGSGRSIHGVHLYQLISVAHPLLLRYGGHELAAGMSLGEDRLEELKKTLQKQLEENTQAGLFVPREYYDMEIKTKDITLQLVEDLERLAPLGMGNKTPAFLLRNVRLGGLRLIGENKNHLKFSVVDGSASAPGVGFSKGELYEQIEPDQGYDVIVNVERNTWQGRDSAQVQLKSIRPNVEDNIPGVVAGGAMSFAHSTLHLPPVAQKLESRRMRKMWRGDVYISRRVAKDVFGTAIYTSIPECTRHLLQMLKAQGTLSNLDVSIGKPLDNTCIVISPDWTVTDLPFARLVINDYAPSGFVRAALENNPGLQVVLCHNEDRERMILEFTQGVGLDREALLRYYGTIRQQLGSPKGKAQLILGSENPYRMALILEVFCELGLMSEHEGVLTLEKPQEKRELSGSQVYQGMLDLDDRTNQELKILLEHCNKAKVQQKN